MGTRAGRGLVVVTALLLTAGGCADDREAGEASKVGKAVEAREPAVGGAAPGPTGTDPCGLLSTQQMSELTGQPMQIQTGVTVTADMDRYAEQQCTYVSELGDLSVSLTVLALDDPDMDRGELRTAVLAAGEELAAKFGELLPGVPAEAEVLPDHPLSHLTGNSVVVEVIGVRTVYVLDSPVPFAVGAFELDLSDLEGEGPVLPLPADDELLRRVAEAVLRS
jgi:hypothetical protein